MLQNLIFTTVFHFIIAIYVYTHTHLYTYVVFQVWHFFQLRVVLFFLPIVSYAKKAFLPHILMICSLTLFKSLFKYDFLRELFLVTHLQHVQCYFLHDISCNDLLYDISCMMQ